MKKTKRSVDDGQASLKWISGVHVSLSVHVGVSGIQRTTRLVLGHRRTTDPWWVLSMAVPYRFARFRASIETYTSVRFGLLKIRSDFVAGQLSLTLVDKHCAHAALTSIAGVLGCRDPLCDPLKDYPGPVAIAMRFTRMWFPRCGSQGGDP